MTTINEKLSKERKQLQAEGLVPEWMSTAGFNIFKSKFQGPEKSVKARFYTIARSAAKHTDDPESWTERFFQVMWKGWLACSTPVLSNMGTNRGLPVSCSGAYLGDSIESFYEKRKETAILTKNGFGTSGYLGDVRHRGAAISSGGEATGALEVIKLFIKDMQYVSQGNTRRGAWAGYVPFAHKDFHEIASHLHNAPEDFNLGWNVHDADIEKLQQGDAVMHEHFSKSLKVKATNGKGYYFFPDKVNRLSPQMYKDLGLKVLASNLCTEINLFSDAEHTFTCVLSSGNLAKYDEWKDTDFVFVATVFLDCVAQEFIERAKQIPGLECAVRFTEKSRALGLGTLGYHTYLQDNMIPFEGFQAHMKNLEIFQHMQDESLRASQWMAKAWGEPEWCKGYGVRNTHRLAVAPNTTSAQIVGGVSQGIEPMVANVFVQPSSSGDISRINPSFLKLVRAKGRDVDEPLIKSINDNLGSVQHLDWLSELEKDVFKTAYEIDQKAIIRQAAARQPKICQGQSLNLFFAADEDEGYIAEVHQEAFENPNIKQLYYMRTMAGVSASKGECVACEG